VKMADSRIMGDMAEKFRSMQHSSVVDASLIE